MKCNTLDQLEMNDDNVRVNFYSGAKGSEVVISLANMSAKNKKKNALWLGMPIGFSIKVIGLLICATVQASFHKLKSHFKK